MVLHDGWMESCYLVSLHQTRKQAREALVNIEEAERGIDSKREGRSRFDPPAGGAWRRSKSLARFVEPGLRPRVLIRPLSPPDQKKPRLSGAVFGLAEREGFEPSIRY